MKLFGLEIKKRTDKMKPRGVPYTPQTSALANEIKVHKKESMAMGTFVQTAKDMRDMQETLNDMFPVSRGEDTTEENAMFMKLADKFLNSKPSTPPVPNATGNVEATKSEQLIMHAVEKANQDGWGKKHLKALETLGINEHDFEVVLDDIAKKGFIQKNKPEDLQDPVNAPEEKPIEKEKFSEDPEQTTLKEVTNDSSKKSKV